MSVYAISSAALSHLRPLVVNIVDQNVKEIRRSSNYIDSAEEQKHLNYIADTMESSVETATRALDCKDIINNIKMTSTPNPSLTNQLDEILKKQSEILQISANSLLNSKKHYSQQYMPGGLSNTATTTKITKSLALNDNNDTNTPNNDSDILCKDTNTNLNIDDIENENENDNDNDNNNAMDLQQIFNKLQISVQNMKDNKTALIKNVNINNSNNEEKKDEMNEDNNDNDNDDNKGIFEMRRIWVKSLVLATHFVTAVWLTLKDEVDINGSECIQNKKTPK